MHVLTLVPERYARVVRFLIAGGSAAAVTLLTFYVLTDMLGVWYVVASVCGFCTGLVVSFTLQKFWTFADRGMDRIKRQFATYLSIVLINLALNTILIYCLVEYAHLQALLAQIITSAVIACEGYFAYKFLVFHPEETVKDHVVPESI